MLDNSMLCMSNNFKMIHHETKVKNRRVSNLKTRRNKSPTY